MSLAQKYYSILGLPSTAGINAIKKAYRTKAKQLHPDLNPSPKAEEDFIELNEAYEYLIALKTNKGNKKQYQQVNDFEKWWRAEEAKRKEKARKQAQMRYEEYINSTDYKLNNAFDVLFFYILISFAIALPILFYFMFFGTLFPALVMAAIISPLLYSLIKHTKNKAYSLSALKLAVNTIFSFTKSKFNWFVIAGLIGLNFYIIYTIVLDTFITTSNLLIIYIGIPILSYLVISFSLKNHKFFNHKRIISFILLPLLLNTLFLINYHIASGESVETYHYRIDFSTKSITLKNSKYKDCWGVRTIIKDYNNFLALNHITYTIKEGALGLRVVSDYKLFLSFDNI